MFDLPFYYEFAIKIVTIILLSGIIGLERGMHGRAAGLRTHVMVGLGSTLFTELSIYFSEYGNKLASESSFFSDPGRVAAQIVAGIGFLGAGVIIKEGTNIRGITTASCMWMVAALGMAVGAGLFSLAIITTFCSLFALIAFDKFEKFLPRNQYRTVTIVLDEKVNIENVISTIENMDIQIQATDFFLDRVNQVIKTRFDLKFYCKKSTRFYYSNMLDKFQKNNIEVKSLDWHS
jgi:putative Mg2+ transporter-C (MgtC) family protein